MYCWWRIQAFFSSVYQTTVHYEVKPFDTFLVIPTLQYIFSVSVHQRQRKCTLGRTLRETLSVKIITLPKPHVHSKSLQMLFLRSSFLAIVVPEISEQLDAPVDPWRALLVTLLQKKKKCKDNMCVSMVCTLSNRQGEGYFHRLVMSLCLASLWFHISAPASSFAVPPPPPCICGLKEMSASALSICFPAIEDKRAEPEQVDFNPDRHKLITK